MQVVLLERVEKLGQIGDVVKVKDGFARNYLLPKKKALRATKGCVATSATSGRTLTGFSPVRSSELPVIILRWIWVDQPTVGVDDETDYDNDVFDPGDFDDMDAAI